MFEIKFDLDRIVKIRIRGERINDWYAFKESEPIYETHWFRQRDTGRRTPEGFEDLTKYYANRERLSKEDVESLGFKVVMKEPKSESQVIHRACVTLFLEYGQEVEKYFSNDDLAKNWVLSLETKANKKFETVTYD